MAYRVMDSEWLLSSSSDPDALAVVDGLGRFSQYGPHYSRRTPGSKTFTGVGQEVVLLHESMAAVWAVVRQCTPRRAKSGASRGRAGITDQTPMVWRNMMFRRLPECKRLSSELIKTATSATYHIWIARYGSIPPEQLRTEIDIKRVKSNNPGCCYLKAGWKRWKTVRWRLYLIAPDFVAAT